ncbi:MAG: RNA-processing protein [Candidatus Altiarchaeota archaeon]|nr:RNA-processing protein [Candidatus Altiarchaeota archaeon]
MQYLKIPRERIAVLVGEGGSVKKEMEERTQTRITIEDTAVTIETCGGDYLKEITATNMVHAIGRGFNPETAFTLLKEDYTLEIIHLRDYTNTPKSFERIKSRIIGERGRARKNIEQLSCASIAVYGKTIALIGSFDDVAMAKEAVLKIIKGARHSSVYRFLEKSRVERKMMPWNP